MLADVTPYLRCPVCHDGLAPSPGTLGCPQGHRFDVARHGYVSLLSGDARTGTADTPDMVAARVEFLASGEYAALTDAVAQAVAGHTPSGTPGCVLDAGGGTGHHLAAVLDRCPDRVGVCCDLSRYAARRAARAHPRLGAVVGDVWRQLPLRDAGAAAVVNVFAPRNPDEFHRVLHPDGVLVVVTPQQDHLRELVRRLRLLSVEADKADRLHAALGRRFAEHAEREVRWTVRLSPHGVRALVAMGPSSWHRSGSDDLALGLPDPLEVTAAVRVTTYVPLPC